MEFYIGKKYKYMKDEFHPKLRHDKAGVLTMANRGGKHTNGSQFILTMKPLPILDDKHTVFGQVSEGMEILEKINSSHCNKDGRPYRNIRIRHTCILDDPFSDPTGFKNR
eukprot:UN33690